MSDETTDGLPPLAVTGRATEAVADAFWRDGYVVIPSLFTPEEVAAYAAPIRAAAEADFAAQGGALTFGGAFHQSHDLRRRSDAVARFALSARLGEVAAALLRVPAVRVYHDQALFKPPGGVASYWHQDQYFWPLRTDRALGLWLPLQDTDETMGTMRYAAGSHRLGDLGQHTINEASEAFFGEVIEREGLAVRGSGPMRLGDAAFHLGWTVHGALPNRSDRLREAMVVTFYPDGTHVDALTNDYRAKDARLFLGGRQPGERADDPGNALVWPR